MLNQVNKCFLLLVLNLDIKQKLVNVCFVKIIKMKNFLRKQRVSSPVKIFVAVLIMDI